MSDYQGVCKAVTELTTSERQRLAALYLRYYDGCDESRFFADLDDKSEVLLLYHGAQLAGFTTWRVYPFAWQRMQLRIVFSGDTVIERAHWGQQTFAYNWVSRMGRLYMEAPDVPLYWFLIVKGHRTYRFLPLIAQSFFPHWARDEPELQALADALAAQRFGAAYDPQCGLIRFDSSHGHMKAEIAHPGERERNKEAVRFFLQRNPGYAQGDEMVCLCPLRTDNMRTFIERVFLGERK